MPTKALPISRVTVVGTGVIGRSWVQVFARAGCQTCLYDRDPKQVEKALALLSRDLKQDVLEGFQSASRAEACLRLVTSHSALKEALAGSGYVQESGPEQIEMKRAIYSELDHLADPSTILASSTSAIDMTEIASGLRGASRCIVAHPVNPPHIVPVVEILPGKETEPRVVKRTTEFLHAVGQTPVLMNFFVPGFLLNRMQAALVREAIHLVESGVADVNSVDAVIRDGLGLRWALMGPFGVANTNADGGVREYFTRYRGAYTEIMNDLGPTPAFEPDQIERWGQATDAMVGETPREQIHSWRDRMVRKIRMLKQDDLPR
jgi:L-gulonate 3-dehydrogenase